MGVGSLSERKLRKVCSSPGEGWWCSGLDEDSGK